MKVILFLVGIGFSTLAQASYYQISCSNADATVQLYTGHSKDAVIFTERAYTGSQPLDTQLKLELNEVKVEELTKKELSTFESNNCENGQDFGVWERTTHTYKEVKFQKADGSHFLASIVNVDEDLTSVTAHLICKESFNSLAPCRSGE